MELQCDWLSCLERCERVVSGPLLRLWVLPGIHVEGGPGWVSAWDLSR
jgi:hypothetical protein